jgi:hypothetical protein
MIHTDDGWSSSLPSGRDCKLHSTKLVFRSSGWQSPHWAVEVTFSSPAASDHGKLKRGGWSEGEYDSTLILVSSQDSHDSMLDHTCDKDRLANTERSRLNARIEAKS